MIIPHKSLALAPPWIESHIAVKQERSVPHAHSAHIIALPLTLTPGTRLGVYEVVASIGEGGMGEVYRARDTKLDRDVAIKVLPEAFAHDADRLARFQREAQDPRLAESSEHRRDLRPRRERGHDRPRDGTGRGRRLSRIASRAGAIPLDEALPIAKQIAEALEAAHEQGHHPPRSQAREHQGPAATAAVKVLDFGLAKVMEPEPGATVVATSRSRQRCPAETVQG